MAKHNRPARRSSRELLKSSSDGRSIRLGGRTAIALALLALGSIVAVGVLLIARGSPATLPVPVSTVATDDVHSLAFLGSPERVVLGHHGGILESPDGGSTWTPWGQGSDAMAMGIAGDQSIIVAGHDVLALGSRDGSWQSIANDLPNKDIHGFARDPGDPSRVWAYLAAGGVFESKDAGTHWAMVFGGHALGLLAVASGNAARLIAVDPERAATVASDDGGRTWRALGAPPSTPVYAMASANGGDTILLSGSAGLFRSDDGGRSFSPLLEVAQPILAVATTADGTRIVLATRDGRVYRSEDGGQSWPSN